MRIVTKIFIAYRTNKAILTWILKVFWLRLVWAGDAGYRDDPEAQGVRPDLSRLHRRQGQGRHGASPPPPPPLYLHQYCAAV